MTVAELVEKFRRLKIRGRGWWKVPDYGMAWMKQAKFMTAISTRTCNSLQANEPDAIHVIYLW